MMTFRLVVVVVMSLSMAAGAGAANRPERVEWFMDQGLGMFVHWSVDSQLGSVISHSMVGASDDYLSRFINDLPETFYPCLLYTSPSPRDRTRSRMPSSA